MIRVGAKPRQQNTGEPSPNRCADGTPFTSRGSPTKFSWHASSLAHNGCASVAMAMASTSLQHHAVIFRDTARRAQPVGVAQRHLGRPLQRVSRAKASSSSSINNANAESPAGTAQAKSSSSSSAAAAEPPSAAANTNNIKPTAVVVGGGWAGFGAAWQLLKHGFDVTLLDASQNPGGLSAGWRTANGRAVEAGPPSTSTHFSARHEHCLWIELGAA